MATKKVTAKKTTPAKKGVAPRKVASASKVKLHAKNVNLCVSIGNDDRKRTVEQMQDALRKAIESAGFKNVTVMSSYYILDGKVCQPQDYDEKTQDFLPGKTSPSWAGGPAVNVVLEKVGQEEFKVEKPIYTPKENMAAVRPILEKNAAKKRGATTRPVDEDDELEEFDWEVGDVSDEAKLEAVASKSRKVAIKKLTGAKKTAPAKRVVKKTVAKKAAPSRRRVVRRK